MKRLNAKAQYKYAIVFIIGVLITNLFIVWNFDYELVYDASDYWNCGMLFGYERLDFRGWYHPFRGYLTSFIWYCIQRLSLVLPYTPAAILCLFMALLHAVAMMIQIPYIMEKLFDVKLKQTGRLMLLVCTMYFYKGILIYPLSDYLAFVCLSTNISLFLLAKNTEINWKKYVYLCFGSMAGGGGYFARPVYLANAIILIILLILITIDERKIACLIFGLSGMVLVSLPQSISNYTNYGTISPIVRTEYQGGDDLYLQQLSWGVKIQRYETNTNLDIYPEAGVRFPSERGIGLMEKEHIEEFGSYVKYIQFVLKHFVSVVLIYLKHLFNGVDMVYTNVYIKNMYINRFPIQLLNYSLIFFGVLGMIDAFKRKKWRLPDIFFAVLWFLPVLLSIPTAVETRFFMNMNIVLYCFACYNISTFNLKKLTSGRAYIAAGCWIAALAICFYLNYTTFSSIGIPLW